MGSAASDLFLQANFDVRCYSLPHWLMIVGLSIPLAIYVIGIPLGTYKLLSEEVNNKKVRALLDIEAITLQTSPSDHRYIDDDSKRTNSFNMSSL